MKRPIAPLSLLFVVALAGCSSTPSTVAPSVSPTETAVASSPSETASQSAAESTSPSEAPTSAPVAGGTATDFCGAFKELSALTDAPSGDLASTGAKFQTAAADVRKFAPAEIKDAATAFADLMDDLGKAAAGGFFDAAALKKAVSDGIAGNAAAMDKTAAWVAKNCNH